MGAWDFAGQATGQATNIGLRQSGLNPSASGMIGGAVSDALRGADLSRIAANTGMRAARTVAGNVLNRVGLASPVIGPAMSMGSGLIGQMQQVNPNYSAAALSSAVPSLAGAIAGSMFGPIGAVIGGMIAGEYTQGSMREGWMGDLTDARSYERARDFYEDQGLSRAQSAAEVGGYGMTSRDVDFGQSGYADPGAGTDYGGGFANADYDAPEGFGRAALDPSNPADVATGYQQGWGALDISMDGGGGMAGVEADLEGAMEDSGLW
ncbi:MAG: hypothetical protein KZQ81_14280 [Candidatus Thiodiazotropha sp. (ex Rostrolucina anterorostrata)]|nr:hypothetical protein [Candidatus Thiodiazotropha sp. (ex Rostrolucina anterorostrata)]